MAKVQLPKQSSLDLEQPQIEQPSDEPVVIYVGDSQRIDTLKQQMNNGLSKADLYQYGQVFDNILKSRRLVVQFPDGRQRESNILKVLNCGTSRKIEMAESLAVLFSDGRNLQYLLDTFTPKEMEVWKYMMRYFSCPEPLARKMMHTNVELYRRAPQSYSEVPLNSPYPALNFFNMKVGYGYYDQEVELIMPSILYTQFAPAFYNAQRSLAVSELPADLKTIQFENENIESFPVLMGLIQSGAVRYVSTGPHKTDIKRVVKKMGLTEYYTDSDKLELTTLHRRTLLIALTIAFMEKSALLQDTEISYPAVLRRLIKRLSSVRRMLPLMLYPHINGLSGNILTDNSTDVIVDFMLQMLSLYGKAWISIDRIIDRFYLQENDSGKLFKHLSVFNSAYSDYSLRNECTASNIGSGDYVREFGLVAFRSAAFMLCSLGIAEIAVQEGLPTATPFDQVDYVRLTPLGYYVLELTNAYDALQLKQRTYFELDDHRLIIRSLTTPNPYEPLLRESTVSIGNGRFEMTPHSFLLKCRSEHDVQAKIKNLRQILGRNIPQVWEDFFQSMLRRCHPLREERVDYCIFRVNPEDADLIRLLTSNSELRSMIILAEDYRILVKRTQVQMLRFVLIQNGYLL